MSNETPSFLHYFIIFDAVPPKEEGAIPKLYWKYSPEANISEEAWINYTGLLITFINFCQKWGTSDICDYISTENHEIALLPLRDSIWMAVSLQSSSSSKRSLLHSMLLYCRSMFSFFFAPSTDPIPENVHNYLDEPFKFIVESIDWVKLDFTLLYDSYIEQPINRGYDVLKDLCDKVIHAERSPFENIMIIGRRHQVIVSSFPSEVTRALASGMRKRFAFFYRHKPMITNDFSWLIGLYYDIHNIKSIYQPPIYYDGKIRLLVAFKYHNFKIVLSNRPDLIFDSRLFDSMPNRLVEIKEFLKTCYPKKMPFRPMPFIYSINTPSHSMSLESDQINSQSRFFVNRVVVFAHETALNYDKKASIGFPGDLGFFVKIRKTEAEAVTIIQPENQAGISENLKVAGFIEKPSNTDVGERPYCSVQ